MKGNDYGDWTEDYHQCEGEYECEVNDGLICIRRVPGEYWLLKAAARNGRHRRPRTVCESCGQETGLAPKEAE